MFLISFSSRFKMTNPCSIADRNLHMRTIPLTAMMGDRS